MKHKSSSVKKWKIFYDLYLKCWFFLFFLHTKQLLTTIIEIEIIQNEWKTQQYRHKRGRKKLSLFRLLFSVVRAQPLNFQCAWMDHKQRILFHLSIFLFFFCRFSFCHFVWLQYGCACQTHSNRQYFGNRWSVHVNVIISFHNHRVTNAREMWTTLIALLLIISFHVLFVK